MRTRGCGSGFTLLELILSFSLLTLAFVIVLPQYNKMRSNQMANQLAQELASDIRRMSSESLKGETYTFITTSTTGYTIYKIPSVYSWIPSNWTIIKSRDFTGDYSRASFSAGGGANLPLGQRGWPVQAGQEPNAAITNTATLQPSDGKGQYYRWTCSAGAGIPTYTVKVYLNGRVAVETP